jgi:hypothetical protein
VVAGGPFVVHTGAGGFDLSISSNVIFLFGNRLLTPP